MHYLPETKLALGGVTRAVLDICQVMASRGHRVTLATNDAGDVPEAWSRGEARSPRAVLLSGKLHPGGILGRGRVAQVQSLFTPGTLLHLHGPWAPGNLQLARAARRAGVPYVVTTHGMLDDWSLSQKRLKKRLALALGVGRFLAQAATIHCTAKAEAQQAQRHVPDGRVSVVPCLFDAREYLKLPGPEPAERKFFVTSSRRPRVLFLSRLHEKKGADVLIAAAGIVRDRGLECQTVLAGPGEPKYVAFLEEEVRRLGLTDRVAFVGMVSGELKLSLYEAADLMVVPTSQENFGFVFVEALACGTPVLTTRGVDIWEELEAAGATIVERRAEAVAAAIQKLVADSSELKSAGLRGRAYILDWLDVERIGEQYERMYETAVNNK